jgi:hypothetical protein
MKYIVVLAIVIVLVRIDFFVGQIEKVIIRLTPAPPEVEASLTRPQGIIIPVSEDENLQQSPRETYLALLASFRVYPEPTIPEKAMEIFKAHPTIFTDKLDRELESQVFRWQELLHNYNPEVVNFILDLSKILQGENLEMLKKFWALWMDIDMENFILAYTKSKDSNCSIATTFGFNIPEEEKLKEYYDREDALRAVIAKSDVPPTAKALANNCLLVLGLEINKIAPPPEPEPFFDPEGVFP